MIRTIGDTLPPFALYDQDGNIVTTDYFDGSVTVMNFIFSRCSVAEMCPASTMKMKKLQELAKKTDIEHIRFLSITLDPEFDSPEFLNPTLGVIIWMRLTLRFVLQKNRLSTI